MADNIIHPIGVRVKRGRKQQQQQQHINVNKTISFLVNVKLDVNVDFIIHSRVSTDTNHHPSALG
jgi:hypothetical protein